MSKVKPVLPPKPKTMSSSTNSLDLSHVGQSELNNSSIDSSTDIIVNEEKENDERNCRTFGISEVPSCVDNDVTSVACSAPGGRFPRPGPKTFAKPSKRNESNLELSPVTRSRSDSNSSSVSAADDTSDLEQETGNQSDDDASHSRIEETLESLSGQEVKSDSDCPSTMVPTHVTPHFPVKPTRLKKSTKFSINKEMTSKVGVDIVSANVVCEEATSNDGKLSDSCSIVVSQKNFQTFPKPKARKNLPRKNCDLTVESLSPTTSDADVNDSGKMIRTQSYEKALDENDFVLSKPVLKEQVLKKPVSKERASKKLLLNESVLKEQVSKESASKKPVDFKIENRTAANVGQISKSVENVSGNDDRNINIPSRCAPLPPASSSKPKPPTMQKRSNLPSAAVSFDSVNSMSPSLHERVRKEPKQEEDPDAHVYLIPRHERPRAADEDAESCKTFADTNTNSLKDVRRSSFSSFLRSSKTRISSSDGTKGRSSKRSSGENGRSGGGSGKNSVEKRSSSIFYYNLDELNVTVDDGRRNSFEVATAFSVVMPTNDKQEIQVYRKVSLPITTTAVVPPPRRSKKQRYPTLDTNIPHPYSLRNPLTSASDINDTDSSMTSLTLTENDDESSPNLDSFVPFPGQTLVDRDASSSSSNVYSEINNCDELMDEQGYSMINDGVIVAYSEYASVEAEYVYSDKYLVNKSRSMNYDLSKSGNDAPLDRYASSCDTNVRRLQKETSDEENESRPTSWVVCDTRSRSPLNDEKKKKKKTMTSLVCKETEEEKQKSVEKKKQKAFLTAQELLTSEKTFVEVLHLLSEDFTAAINKESAVLGKAVVAPGVVSQIIKYLPELQKFNEELLQDLNLRIKNWDEDPRLADIFVKKGAFLKMYTNYIREFNSMVALLDETRRKNAEFDRVVTDFESNRCAKLALKHYMLKPIQRIPQYRMLLTDYRNQLNEDALDFKDANMAILIVHEVAEHANQSMKYGDNLNKLLQIQNSLIGQFEVIVPGRVLLKEGILMKLSRKEMQPRMFYLFSDVLLYTTPVGSGFKLNNILQLTGMKVSHPSTEDFQNEFSIISTQRSFTLSARTEQERTEWLNVLEEAITEIKQKRYSYSQGKLTVPSIVSIDHDAKDFNLGTKAPVWIPDDRVSMCMICKEEFSLLFRRHHCRGCGKVICANCSSYEAPLQYLQYKPERVCSECFVELTRVIDEMDDFIPDVMLPSTPGETLEENNRFSKQNIKNQFKCFAAAGNSKSNQPRRPAVLHEVNANDESAELSGYLCLWKERKWKKTWFVLKEKVLYTFKASEDAAAEKSTPLLGYEITPLNTYFQGIEPNLLFELCHRGMPSTIFKTESPQSRERWMSAMRRSTMP